MDYSGKFSKLSEQTVGYRNEQDFLYKVSLIAMNYETPPQTTQYGKIQTAPDKGAVCLVV